MGWVLRVVGAGLVLFLVVPAAAPAGHTAEESTLIVDLGAEGAVVEEHTARLLWNLMTDNVTDQNAVGWNSLYLDQPEAVSGRVVADLRAGTLTGDIIERWTCTGDCRTSTGTPSWTTTRDTGWTATITDGRLEPDGDRWTVTGLVTISYDAAVTADETPSDCGGTPCYLCANRVCEVGGTTGTTAPLEGWIEGRTLSLAFADRMEADVYQMDLSELEKTEFFMARFSITITPPPGSGSAGGPAGQEPGTATTTSSARAPVQDVPAGRVIPGVEAGSPPGPDDEEGNEPADAENGDGGEPGVEASSDAEGRSPATGLWLAVILLLIALGCGSLLLHLFLEKKAQEGDLSRAPAKAPPLRVPGPGEKTYRVGDSTTTYKTTIEQVEAQPIQPPITLVGTKESGYAWVEGQDERGLVHRYEHGTKVTVVERKGKKIKVLAPNSTTMWVDRRNLR